VINIIIYVASSIKVSNETIRELDKLLANLLRNYDLKFTQQNIIDLLIKFTQSNMELLFSSVQSPSKDILNKIKKLQKPWNIDTDPETIDNILYDEDLSFKI